MRSVALLCLCACNEIYGLDATRLPPPDAPYACPPISGGAPVFSSTIYQDGTEERTSYHFNASGTLAVAEYLGRVYVGRLGEPLEHRPEIVTMTGDLLLDPHPSPDGDRIYAEAIREPLLHAIPVALEIWERAGTRWQYAGSPPELAGQGRPSTVFRGPTGDRIIFHGATIEEWEDEGGTWQLRGKHTREALMIDGGAVMALTSDGLRAVYRGATTMLYTDRRNFDEPFRTPEQLVGVPRVFDAQLTDDCARVYYTGASSGIPTVFYSQQQ